MVESIITVLIIGLLAGFLFSMPIAGPISIIVTSNALKGKQRYCDRVSIGASIIEFFYVFIVVIGLTKLYNYYKDYVPHILIIGAVFLFVVAYKIVKTNLDFDSINLNETIKSKIENKGGFRTGVFLNLTNPSLLFGWLSSSFVVLSFASSIGLNTGGLDLLVSENLTLLSNESAELINSTTIDKNNSEFILSILYAFGVAVGCYIWFAIFSRFIIKYRHKFKISSINILIRSLGYILFVIGFYLIWKSLNIIF